MNPPARRIDCHVHLCGDNSDGSGCYFHLPSVWKKVLARLMLKEAGLPVSFLSHGLDRGFREAILRYLDDSDLDAVVLLAQDWPHDDSGHPLRDKAGFFVPNDYLLDVCAQSGGKLIPAVSIHPYRKDACQELERCVNRGAKVLKLLPNCHNADCNKPQTRDFWKLVADTQCAFLCHTGGEYSVPVLDRALETPEVLRQPLDCGVTCIAAHGAGSSAPLISKDHTEMLVKMFREYPHLYCDNSALSTLNRCKTAKRLLKPDAIDRVLHGSDFPVPVGAIGPWLHGMVSWTALRTSAKQSNPFQRDVDIKRAMGFPEETFTRLDGILRRQLSKAGTAVL